MSIRHVCNLLSYERKRPGEDIHKVRKPVRMGRTVELTDIHHIVLVLENSGLVVVDIQVVGCAENRHHTGKASECESFGTFDNQHLELRAHRMIEKQGSFLKEKRMQPDTKRNTNILERYCARSIRPSFFLSKLL